ncbi:MAG: hypothetical protein ACK5PF_07080 [bacterium]|jgi:hypothetical protein
MNMFAITAAATQILNCALPVAYSADTASTDPRPVVRQFAPKERSHADGSRSAATSDVYGVNDLSVSRLNVIAVLTDAYSFQDDWDAQGASAPDQASLDAAISFLERASLEQRWEPTIHADGRAVLEREEGSVYVELTFDTPNDVIVYKRDDNNGMAVVRTLSLQDVLATAEA